MRGQRQTAIAVLAACALLLPSAASAKTIRLNWTERTPAGTGGYLPMTFKVKSVTVRSARWTVSFEVHNRSRKELSIRRGSSYYPTKLGFALLVPSQCPPDPGFTRCGVLELAASSFTPRRPRSLRPGERWSGTFSGNGALRKGVNISIGFGVFVPRGSRPFSWSTQHTFRA
jgi:hypothetical protein